MQPRELSDYVKQEIKPYFQRTYHQGIATTIFAVLAVGTLMDSLDYNTDRPLLIPLLIATAYVVNRYRIKENDYKVLTKNLKDRLIQS